MNKIINKALLCLATLSLTGCALINKVGDKEVSYTEWHQKAEELKVEQEKQFFTKVVYDMDGTMLDESTDETYSAKVHMELVYSEETKELEVDKEKSTNFDDPEDTRTDEQKLGLGLMVAFMCGTPADKMEEFKIEKDDDEDKSDGTVKYFINNLQKHETLKVEINQTIDKEGNKVDWKNVMCYNEFGLLSSATMKADRTDVTISASYTYAPKA